MQRIFIALILALGIASNPSRGADTPAKPEKLREIPNLTADERNVLYTECEQKLHLWSGDLLVQKDWGPALVKLNPVFVIDHLANVKIVLNNTDTVESGFYLTMMRSSYIPSPKDFTEFTLVSKDGDKIEGNIYRYSIRKGK